ncbi:MAG: MFS transporter [Gammaproteobacteria bacterium]
MAEKQRLSFAKMVNLNFGFLGIQFGWALQMANMSGIYKFLGADVSNMGYLWLAAPLSGMIIQPILGYFSDRTWCRLGRRRPYILAGALISTLALILMPNSPSIWFAATLLWLLDGSINVAMQPYRALVADVSPSEQHTTCYSIQTCLVGVGSTLASILPWMFLHVFGLQSNPADSNVIPITLRLSFYIGAGVFLLSNLWTVFASKEYPPTVVEKVASALHFKKDGSLGEAILSYLKSFGELLKIPKIMREVSYVQFFSWLGMFCVFLYYGIGVAQSIFGLPPDAQVEGQPVYHRMLEDGIALGGMCFATYTFVSIIVSALLPKISKLITRKGAHALCLTLGALGLIASNHVHSSWGLFICMIGLGAAWASIVTIPYAILAGSLPEDKMGLYMGLLNITICVPEILAALTLGGIAKAFFSNHAMSVVELGGFAMIIAVIFTFFIRDRKK